jgi:hypothetical protein
MKKPKTKVTKSLIDTMHELGQKYGVEWRICPDGEYEESASLVESEGKTEDGILSVIGMFRQQCGPLHRPGMEPEALAVRGGRNAAHRSVAATVAFEEDRFGQTRCLGVSHYWLARRL